jgi:hypothetical protein
MKLLVVEDQEHVLRLERMVLVTDGFDVDTAAFYPAGRGHSVTSAVGSAWEREPWIVVQGGVGEQGRGTVEVGSSV